MVKDFFEAGGVVMFPTLLFGFGLTVGAALHALKVQRRWLELSGAAAALTLFSGLLGTTLGLVGTLRYVQSVPAQEVLQVATLGAAESLNNLVLALLYLVLAALLVTVGAARSARAD